jgi:hypothetical protein
MDICPKCGYNELQDRLNKMKFDKTPEKCYTCKYWTCANALGSFCSKQRILKKKNNIDDCYEEK